MTRHGERTDALTDAANVTPPAKVEWQTSTPAPPLSPERPGEPTPQVEALEEIARFHFNCGQLWYENVIRKAESDLAELRATVTRLTRERDELLRFAGKAIGAARMENIGCDWDGGDMQDAMVECGLLAEMIAQESCGENCHCAEYDEFPQTCYRLTDLGLRASRAPDQEKP